MSSGFQIRGMEELQKAIAEAYSGAKARKIQREAVEAGADLVVEQLKSNFAPFKDKGYSQDEIMHSDAKTKNDVVEVKVGWNGPHDRWRLIHLNEFGYTKKGKQYTPTGFGAIDKTINQTKNDYFEAVAGKMREQL